MVGAKEANRIDGSRSAREGDCNSTANSVASVHCSVPPKIQFNLKGGRRRWLGLDCFKTIEGVRWLRALGPMIKSMDQDRDKWRGDGGSGHCDEVDTNAYRWVHKSRYSYFRSVRCFFSSSYHTRARPDPAAAGP